MEISEKRLKVSGKWKVLINEALCKGGLAEAVISAIEGKGSEALKRLKSSETSRVWKFGFGGVDYAVKEFLGRGFFEPIKTRFKGTRAMRAWKGGRLLLENGFKTPPLVMEIEGPGARNFLVTAFVDDVTGLFTLSRELAKKGGAEASRIRRRCARALGDTVGRMHALGLVHGDLRLENILIKGAEHGRCELFFIDNERNVKYPRRPPIDKIEWNLVQISMVLVPDADRAACFAAYLKRMPELKARKTELGSKVMATARKRIEKKHGRSI
ncbi:MAG: lipopolysaccharide kinase InaA family protein [Deltaproteobacteria bacterium]|nr:lipopolysaccharide kinase InaA family protein [Deltaproteobacteria bacterium]